MEKEEELQKPEELMNILREHLEQTHGTVSMSLAENDSSLHWEDDENEE